MFTVLVFADRLFFVELFLHRSGRLKTFPGPLILRLVTIQVRINRQRLFYGHKRLNAFQSITAIGHVQTFPDSSQAASFHCFICTESLNKAAACSWLMRDSVNSMISATCFIVSSR